MEDPSIKKRLIDFGTNEHENDAVQELPEESNNQQSTQQQHKQKQPTHTNTKNNNTKKQSTTATSITADTAAAAAAPADIPHELPPPKQKAAKNSKKSKSKSKIPRSPSLASSLNSNTSSNSNINCSNISLSAIPPQTPPLPVNYQNKSKHMNGGSGSNSNTPAATPISATATTTTLATPLLNSNNNNNGGNNNSNIMGGGVQLSGANGSGGGGGGGIGGGSVINVNNHRGSVNMASSRRPQIQISPIPESPKHFQYLTLTVRKDENGYGMKVSGDNPVFVESVKLGGAAQIAGLVAGDMILKVNGQEVRSEKHPTVVSLIKASTNVELAVKRSQKMTRPTSVGIVPSTPILSGRDRTASITGPQPVDSIKRREMETFKIQTLQKMLEQEKLNLERLKGDTNNPSYKLSEANIRKLREQLRQVGAEDAPTIKYQPTANNKNIALLSPNQIHHLSASSSAAAHHHHQLHHQATTPQPQQPTQSSSPAFLSLLPRSLSSLSLGTRKNKIDKDLITSPLNNTTDFLHPSNHHSNTTSPTPPYNMSQSFNQPSPQQQYQHHRNSTPQQLFYQQQQTQQQLLQQRFKETSKSSSSAKNKNKFAAQAKNLIQEDIPPPLPQRNPPRQLQVDVAAAANNNSNIANNNNSGTSQFFTPISDLDHAAAVAAAGFASSGVTSPQQRNSPPQLQLTASSSSQNKKQRSKAKTKALSDPKMSTQMFLQMETSSSAGGGGLLLDGNCETDCIPPPLPPRQPGMLEECSITTSATSHRGSFNNLNAPTGTGGGTPRPPPNSIETLLTYPLVSTCTPVHRDNMAAAFPLSQRPNIVQQLQQHQQQQQQQQQQQMGGGVGQGNSAALGQTPHNLNSHMTKHRRIASSPENIHTRHPDRLNKTTSGSWELVEKDDEITPPGTPPPPYLTAHSGSMMSGNDDTTPHDSSPSGGIFIESHHFTPLASGIGVGVGGATSPLPSQHSNNRIQVAQSSVTQKEIISMEDEDASDQEGPFIDENGPFNYLQRLLEAENVAFLAVFLNYVLSNSEPAPLLFYLITGLYKEGTAKDMRKWAYEIHSTFLVPRAPLSWYRQDESLAREVDNVLQSEFDKVEILRKVFWKSRKRARDIICEQLREFQQKRTAGLGTIYGPTDAQLVEAKGDKQREQHIFEETLLRKLQILIDEYEKDSPIEDPRKLALCSALSTVIHRIFITRSHPNSIVDRVHHFVSREKSFKSRLMGKNRKMIVRGHPLVLRQYYEVTHCNHCQTIIWGVSPQGYHCTDCKLNIHRSCSKVLDENCPGPLPQSKRKEPHNDNKISKLMGKIRPRTSSDFISMEKRARQEEDFDPADFSNERLHTPSIVRQPSDRRPDAVNISLRSNGNASHNTSDLLQSSYHASSPAAAESSGSGGGDTPLATTPGGAGGAGGTTAGGVAATAMGGMGGSDMNAQDAAGESKDARRERLHQHHQQNKSAPVSVNRSESYKERLSHKRNRNSRRKTSDPSLTSRPNDEQTDLGLSNSNYTASSNSSLSSGGGSESPSTSMEQVGGAAAAGAAAAASGLTQHSHSMHAHHSAPAHAHQHSHQDSFHGSIGGGSSNASFWSGSTIGQLQRQWNFDSDEEDDHRNETDWSSNVAAEVLSVLTDAEKKRQEIINEIYQTERSHVRTLKLLERLFYGPLQESGVLSQDHLSLLFPPALLSLRELHSAFEQKLKHRRAEHNHIVNHIGDLLVSMFDGSSADDLCDFAAQFCARQQIALEALKEKRRKDEQLQKLLSKAESHKACRRLQLKDLLPTVLQRLTKYPLLFENLYKVTIRVLPENTTEAEAIQKALESSKKILVDVNQAVKTAEDAHKLQNIQRKLDKSTFDKDEFKNLDLTQYRLIHDGSLTMKKNPSIQLHGLLFENMIVLLTKQDDKYSLKYLHAARNTEVNNKPVSPIMSIDSETLVRQEAADKNSFFLIKTKTSQMLELRAPSSSECKTWFKHISDAAEQYKPRSKNANHEPVDDPAIATLPHSNTKESLELTPERPPPLSATATVTTTPLAPMMPIATATSVPFASQYNNNNNDSGVQMRNGRRESTPTSAGDSNSSINVSTGSGAYHKQRFSQNELTPTSSSSVSRTMSTRSCGEANNNNNSYGAGESGLSVSNLNGVTLRHTQSARQANGSDDMSNATSLAGGSSSIGGTSNRNSASIVYSNNSNNTRTLMQSSPPLVEPTAIQISISPAHTAELVLTPAEQLRCIDARIRDGLLEKQKIICDMFRLPVEHFNEIVDIAAMPEAPKDSADIALATYAQVQSLTEVLNDYMHVTPEQEISAVSTAVCDQCHEKQRRQRPSTPLTTSSTPSSTTSSSAATQIAADTPPPLPPPNKQPPLKKKQQQSPQQQTPAPSVTKLQTPAAALDTADVDILEDDDGYCEIDELRLPALPPTLLTSATGKSAAGASKSTSPPLPLPPPAGSFKVPPPPPPPPSSSSSTSSPSSSSSTSTSTTTAAAAATTGAAAAVTPTAAPPAELVKRQSTISADSIPEESADEVTQALNDTTITTTTITINSPTSPTAPTAAAALPKDNSHNSSVESEINEQQTDANDKNDADSVKKESQESEETTTTSAATSTADDKVEQNDNDGKERAESENVDANAAVADVDISVLTSTSVAEPQQKKLTIANDDEASPTNVSAITTGELNSSEHIEINDAYDTLAALNKRNTTLSISMVDGMTQTLPMAMFSTITNAATVAAGTNNGAANTNGSHHQLLLCGPNRIQHANSLEPSVPCHALNSIVSALNAQISLLLPKINERDVERERLRKENQHLRELLNAMHERQRVEAKLETPNDITTSADANDEIDGGIPAAPAATAITTTTNEAYETTTADAEN